jgi:membrane protease YdiL (CAAX protease family)
VIGLAAGLMTGLCEELGWTGFVIARLRLRYGVLTTGFERTESLLVATLMHASLTASTIFIFTPVATGASFLIYTSALAGAMWIVVAAVALASSGQLSRRPLQRRMA